MAELREISILSVSPSDPPLPGNANENTLNATPPVSVPSQNTRAVVIAFCQFQLGTGATAYTQRIRRADGVAIASSSPSNPLVGEANSQALPVAQGNIGSDLLIVSETLNNQAQLEYGHTLVVTGQTGAGTAFNHALLVLLI